MTGIMGSLPTKIQMKLSYFSPLFQKDVNDTFQCFNLLCDWRKGEHPSFKMHNQILFHISVWNQYPPFLSAAILNWYLFILLCQLYIMYDAFNPIYRVVYKGIPVFFIREREREKRSFFLYKSSWKTPKALFTMNSRYDKHSSFISQ